MTSKSWHRRLYRRVLRIAPIDLCEYGPEMEQAFDDAVAAHRHRFGLAGYVTVWIGALFDLAAGRREHRRRVQPPTGRHRGDHAMHSLFRDIQYAVRTLRRSPLYTAIAVITLALGIGGNTAMFSVVNGVLLRPLPYHAPDRLAALLVQLRDQEWWSASPVDIQEWRDRNRVFEAITYSQVVNVNLTEVGEPVELIAAKTGANFFDVLGVNPIRGRTFLPGEDVAGAPRVVVLTAGFADRQFGDGPAIGETLRVDGVAHEVVGVMPRTYSAAYIGEHDVIIPRVFSITEQSDRGKTLQSIARLRDGVTMRQAQADMTRIASQLEDEGTEAMAGWRIRVAPLHEQIVGPVRPVLLVLLGAVGFVLLVACANVSNLMLARGAARQRELALRMALGASRRRLCAQLLTEASLLSVVGGVVGLLAALWGTNALLSVNPGNMPRMTEVGVDAGVLGFTLIVSLAAGLLFGIVPARKASTFDVDRALKEAALRATSGRRHQTFRSALIVVETGLVLVLLIGAGLMLRSFWRLSQVDPGFEPAGRVAMRLTVPSVKYPANADVARFFAELGTRLETVPAIRGAGIVTNLPMSSTGWTGYHLIEGRPASRPGEEPIGGMEGVSPGYFRAMGMRLIAGRPFSERDGVDAPKVSIVNEAMAKKYWPDGDPLGHRVKLGPSGSWADAFEVVGVVGGIKYGLNTDVRPRMYIPHAQLPFPSHTRQLVVWTSAIPATNVVPMVRAVVADLDAEQPIAAIRTLDEVITGSIAQPRFGAMLLGVFGLGALVLGAVGVYGVVNYAVHQRVREVGIRVALGASQRRVLGLMVGGALRPVVLGIVAGLLVASVLSRVMTSLLFEIPAFDLLTFGALALLLFAVAFVAAGIPALRVSNVDPVRSLRAD